MLNMMEWIYFIESTLKMIPVMLLGGGFKMNYDLPCLELHCQYILDELRKVDASLFFS